MGSHGSNNINLFSFLRIAYYFEVIISLQWTMNLRPLLESTLNRPLKNVSEIILLSSLPGKGGRINSVSQLRTRLEIILYQENTHINQAYDQRNVLFRCC